MPGPGGGDTDHTDRQDRAGAAHGAGGASDPGISIFDRKAMQDAARIAGGGPGGTTIGTTPLASAGIGAGDVFPAAG